MATLFKMKGQRMPLAKASEILGECYNTIKTRAWAKIKEEHPHLSAASLKALMMTQGVDVICGSLIAHLELREYGGGTAFKCWVRSI